MKPHEDAYGQALYDYYHGDHRVVEIVEREDGFIDTTGGPSAYLSTYAAWPPYLQSALAYAQGRVLDVGCGGGRHALHLQAQGLKSVGIDNSPKAIEVCRLRGLRQAHVLPAAQISSRLGAFDAILMLGNNFGLFANPRRARWLLRRFHGMTSPQARIIAESNDVYATTTPEHLAYQASNRARGRMSGQIRIRVRYRLLKTPWFDYLMVSQDEMRAILEGTGWQIADVLASDGSIYIAIITKIGKTV